MPDLTPLPCFRGDDQESVERLSRLLSDWEPSIWAWIPPRDATLLEPDGTLYAIALTDCELEIPRRRQLLPKGELVVIPRGLPVDPGANAEFLAITHDGTAPDHFRERFIQVRGFDVPGGESLDSEIVGLRQRISRDEVRYQIAYARIDLQSANGNVRLPDCPFLRLVVCIEGEAVLRREVGNSFSGQSLNERAIAVGYPGSVLSVSGDARLGVVEIPTSLEHQERRRRLGADSGSPSPEFR